MEAKYEDDDLSCLMCVKPGQLHCKECNSRYCSQACQKKDWPVHKLLCQEVRSFCNPPTAGSMRAIVFEPAESCPRFKWVQVSGYGVLTSGFGQNDYNDLFGGKLTSSSIVDADPVLNKVLQNAIEVFYGDCMVIDGSPLNQGIVTICKGPTIHPWAGLIVIVHRIGNALDSDRVCDNANMRDLRSAANYFKSYGDHSYNRFVDGAGLLDPNDPENTQGVEVVHERENKHPSRLSVGQETKQTFKDAKVRPAHPVWKAPVSQISDAIGLPIHVLRIRNSAFDLNRTDQSSSYLLLDCNPLSEFFGLISTSWASGGPLKAIVVRKDKKPLLKLHLEIICDFCKHVVGSRLESLEKHFGSNLEIRRRLMDVLTKDAFEAFYIEYIAKMRAKPVSAVNENMLNNMPSPYSM